MFHPFSAMIIFFSAKTSNVGVSFNFFVLGSLVLVCVSDGCDFALLCQPMSFQGFGSPIKEDAIVNVSVHPVGARVNHRNHFIVLRHHSQNIRRKDNLPIQVEDPPPPTRDSKSRMGGGRLLKANCHASQRLVQFLHGKVFKCCHFVTTSLSLVTFSSVVTPQHDSTHLPLSRAPRSCSC